jgi:hypothetical protein
MKYSIPVSVVFMAIALAEFLIKQNTGSVILFAVSTLAFGFLSFLERNRDDRYEAMQRQILEVKNEIGSLSVRLGW